MVKDYKTSAFPQYDGSGSFGGLTLRQWYAGQALVGILATGRDLTARQAAQDAFETADAMLSEGGQG